MEAAKRMAITIAIGLALIAFYDDWRVGAASVPLFNKRGDSTQGAKCADEFNNCQKYKDNKDCFDVNFEKWMKKKCALTCQFCVPPTTTDCRDSPYGCCEDKITPADGPKGKGCSVKLCVDQVVCNKFKSNCDSTNKIYVDWLKENCAATCGFCRAPASPKEKCEQQNLGSDCCWNGDNAAAGCPACVDTNKRICRMFSDKCESKFFNERHYMELNCPQTCKMCGNTKCLDTNARCGSWAAQGLCIQPFWKNYLEKNCAQSCGFCN